MAIAELTSLGAYSPSTTRPSGFTSIITGPWGVGKTHLALTAPAPIVIFDVDHRLYGTVEKFTDSVEAVFPVDWPEDGFQNDYRDIWRKFSEQYDAAIDAIRGKGGTIFIDGWTDLRYLSQEAFCGKTHLEGIPQLQYAKYAEPMRAKVRILKGTDINGIFTCEWGKVWDSNPERWEPKGVGLGDKVECIIHLDWMDGDPTTQHRIGTFHKCGVNALLTGQTLLDPDFDAVLRRVNG